MNYRYVKSPTRIRQSEPAECLLASLAIVTELSGHYYSLQRFRTAFPGYGSGANFGDLAEICAQMDIDVTAAEAEIDSLADLTLPCILHMSNMHFVVLYKITGDIYFVADPELGAYTYDKEDLSDAWSGYLAVFDLSEARFDRLEALEFEERPIVVAPVGRAMTINLIAFNAFILAFTLGATVSISYGIDRGYDGNGLAYVALFLTFSGIGIALGHFKGLFLNVENSNRQRQSGLDLTRILLEKPLQFHQNRHRSSLLTANRMFETEARLTCEKVDKIYIGAAVIVCLLVFSLFLNPILGAVLVVGFICFILVRQLNADSLKWTTLYADVARSRHLLLFQTAVDNALGLKFADRRLRILAQLQRKSENLRASLVSSNRIVLMIMSSHNFVRTLEYAAITGISLVLISKGMESTGTLFAFFILRYLLDVKYAEMMPIIDQLLAVQEGLSAAKSLTGSPPEFPSKSTAVAKAIEGPICIEARGLSFEFKIHSTVFSGIDLTVNQGDFVVLRGASGSGKSTLLRVLAGLMDPSEGDLRLNGAPYDEGVKRALRQKAALIAQEEEIYEGSIYDNVSYFEPGMEKSRIWEACKLARLNEQIRKMPLKYGTVIANGGTNLSGGQRQRMIFARVFYQKPDILFLDEATSQIDAETQDTILRNLIDLNKTIIFASHSDDVEKLATKIVHLD